MECLIGGGIARCCAIEGTIKERTQGRPLVANKVQQEVIRGFGAFGSFASVYQAMTVARCVAVVRTDGINISPAYVIVDRSKRAFVLRGELFPRQVE